MISIFNNKAEIAAQAADIFVLAAQNAIQEHGRFVVALTGGSSPADIYKLLAMPDYKAKIDWNHVYIFWGDERWVALEDERSNAKMSSDYLLDHVAIPKSNIFPMYHNKSTPEDYALQYEEFIKNIAGENGIFDLILLGMGDDGHTASLFPGQDVLKEEVKWVSAYYLDSQSMYRITLTAPIINRAKQIIVVAFGEKKAAALKEVLYGDYNPMQYPMQLIKPAQGKLLFLTDRDAAGTDQ
ncbi:MULTISPECIES: 6-phosphogluconolactonase [unclassified Flavobacterium]|uniref:6-phosphogluconolactonase n=1 Tax=unclassified Flavobacterium TaxID=196869 RepID=UPI0025B87B6C|nr:MULTISPECIES: 6-phosphogluconolactonase [unclassified Flavobacterium]